VLLEFRERTFEDTYPLTNCSSFVQPAASLYILSLNTISRFANRNNLSIKFMSALSPNGINKFKSSFFYLSIKHGQTL
jgi:hypothetical protein